jgi:hypothetical protein
MMVLRFEWVHVAVVVDVALNVADALPFAVAVAL